MEKPKNSYEYRKTLPSFERYKEQQKEGKKKWYEKNKIRVLKYSKQWYHDTIDDPVLKNNRQVRFKKWYEKNKEKHKTNVLNYYFKNKEKNHVRCATNNKKEILKEILGNKCSRCDSVEDLELHHTKYEYQKGLKGKEHIEELLKIIRLLCRNCHRKSHRR